MDIKIFYERRRIFQLRQPYGPYHSAVPRQNLPISAQIGLSNNTVSNLTQLNTTLLTGDDSTTGDADKINVSNTTELNLQATITTKITPGDTLVLVVNTQPNGTVATPACPIRLNQLRERRLQQVF